MDTSASFLRQQLEKLAHPLYDVRRRACHSLSRRLSSGVVGSADFSSACDELASSLCGCVRTFDHVDTAVDASNVANIRSFLDDILLCMFHVAATEIGRTALHRCGAFAYVEDIRHRSQAFEAGGTTATVPAAVGSMATRLLARLDRAEIAAPSSSAASQSTPWDDGSFSSTADAAATRAAQEGQASQATGRPSGSGMDGPSRVTMRAADTTGLQQRGDMPGRASLLREPLYGTTRRTGLGLGDGTVGTDGQGPHAEYDENGAGIERVFEGTSAALQTSIAGAVEACSSSSPVGFVFPWVCLTVSDQHRLIDLLLSLKSAAMQAKASSRWSGQGQQEPDNSVQLPVPECTPSCGPLLSLVRLYLRDFPPEILLSCPAVLTQMLAPLNAPTEGNAQALPRGGTLLTASQQGQGLQEATARRTGRKNSLSRSVDASAPSRLASSAQVPEVMVQAACDALVALLHGLRDALCERTEGGGAWVQEGPVGEDDGTAHAAALTIARAEAHACTRDYASGVGADGQALPVSSVRRFRQSRVAGAGTGGPGRASALSSAGTRGQQEGQADGEADSRHTGRFGAGLQKDGAPAPVAFHHTVPASQRANVERYYGLRYRYPPPLSKAATCLAETTAGTAAALLAAGPVFGYTQSAGGQTPVLDSPIPLHRFAAVVVESCLAACRHAHRLPALIPVLQAALPLMTDPLLILASSSSAAEIDAATAWPGEALSGVQRCLDAAAVSVRILLQRMQPRIFTAFGGASRAEAAGLDAASAPLQLALYSDGPGACSTESILALAHMLERATCDAGSTLTFDTTDAARSMPLVPVGMEALFDCLYKLCASIPRSQLRPETADGRVPPVPSGVDHRDANASGGPSLQSTERLHIKRAAVAKAHGIAVLPFTVIATLSACACVPVLRARHSAVGDWMGQLLPLLHATEPLLHQAVTAGMTIASDIGTLRLALKQSRVAAKAATADKGRRTGFSPAAAAWDGFCSAFVTNADTSHTTTSSPITHEAVAARSAKVLLYTADTASAVCTELCTLAAAAAGAAHGNGESGAVAVQLLHLLLQHPSPTVRETMYTAIDNLCAIHYAEAKRSSTGKAQAQAVLVAPWILHLLGPGVRGQATLAAGAPADWEGSGSCANVLHLACALGLVDVEARVRAAASAVVGSACAYLTVALQATTDEGGSQGSSHVQRVAQAIALDNLGILREAVHAMSSILPSSASASVQEDQQQKLQQAQNAVRVLLRVLGPEALGVTPSTLHAVSTAVSISASRHRTAFHAHGVASPSLHAALTHVPALTLALYASDAAMRASASTLLLQLACTVREESVVQRVIPPEMAAELPASDPVLLSLIARASTLAREATEAQLGVTPSQLKNDPIAYLISAYGQPGEKLPLYPIAFLAGSGSAGSVPAPMGEVIAGRGTAGVGEWDKTLAVPTPAAVVLDPSPAVIKALSHAGGATSGSEVRYHAALALNDQALLQLESILLSPLSQPGQQDSYRSGSSAAPILSWSVRISTAEQIAHALLANAPIPNILDNRLCATASVLLRALRIAEDSGSGSERPAGSAYDSWEEDRCRFVAAAFVALEAITSVSTTVRRTIAHDPRAVLQLVEMLYLGPVLPIAALPLSQHSSGAMQHMGPQLVDARLCAARCLARCLLEAGRGLAIGFEAQRMTESSILSTEVASLMARSALTSGAAAMPVLQVSQSDVAPLGSSVLQLLPVRSMQGGHTSAAEVMIDALAYHARPLLRSHAIAAGPAALTPALSLLPGPAAEYAKDLPVHPAGSPRDVDSAALTGTRAASRPGKGSTSPLTEWIVTLAVEWNKQQSSRLDDVSLPLFPLDAAAQPHSAVAVALFGVPAILHGTALVAALSSADSHEAFLTALRALHAACKADAHLARVVASVCFPVRPTGSSTAAEDETKPQALLVHLHRFLRNTPETEEDQLVLAYVVELIQALVPLLSLDQHSLLRQLCCSSLAGLCLLTEHEVAVADGLLRLHLQHAMVGVPTTPSPTSLPTPLGRAEMLVDSLRPNEYESMGDGYVLDPHGPGGYPTLLLEGTSRSATHAEGSRHTQADAARMGLSTLTTSPFSSGRSLLLESTLRLLRALVSTSTGAGQARSWLTDAYAAQYGLDDAAEARHGSAVALELLQLAFTGRLQKGAGGTQSRRAEDILHVLADVISHPHTPASVRLQCIRLLQDLFLLPEALRCVLNVQRDVPSELCTAQVRPSLQDTIRALIRVCAGGAGGRGGGAGSDSFQHKSLVIAASQVLSILCTAAAGYIRSESAAQSDAILMPSVWVDSGTGTLAWLGRLLVDRDARVRTSGYSIIAALLSSTTGYSHICSDVGLPQMLPICMRHATTSVVALVSESVGFLGRSVLSSSSHADAWDAEAPSVRSACASVLHAHLQAVAATAVAESGSVAEPVQLVQTLQSVDFVGRMRIALASFAASDENHLVASHTPPLLEALSTVSTHSPSTLHAVLSDASVRAGLACLVAQACRPHAEDAQSLASWTLQSRAAAASIPREASITADASFSNGGSFSAALAGRCTSTRGSYRRQSLMAASSAFDLLRAYVTLEQGAQLPLRLRRQHTGPFLLHALYMVVYTAHSVKKKGSLLTPAALHAFGDASASACALLTATIEAWSTVCSDPALHSHVLHGTGPLSATQHPLHDILDAAGRAEDTSASSHSLESDSEVTLGPPLLQRMVQALAVLVDGVVGDRPGSGHSKLPVATRAAAAVCAGTLSASLQGLSSQEGSDPAGFTACIRPLPVSLLAHGCARLYLDISNGEAYNASNSTGQAHTGAQEFGQAMPGHHYDAASRRSSTVSSLTNARVFSGSLLQVQQRSGQALGPSHAASATLLVGAGEGPVPAGTLASPLDLQADEVDNAEPVNMTMASSQGKGPGSMGGRSIISAHIGRPVRAPVPANAGQSAGMAGGVRAGPASLGSISTVSRRGSAAGSSIVGRPVTAAVPRRSESTSASAPLPLPVSMALARGTARLATIAEGTGAGAGTAESGVNAASSAAAGTSPTGLPLLQPLSVSAVALHMQHRAAAVRNAGITSPKALRRLGLSAVPAFLPAYSRQLRELAVFAAKSEQSRPGVVARTGGGYASGSVERGPVAHAGAVAGLYASAESHHFALLMRVSAASAALLECPAVVRVPAGSVTGLGLGGGSTQQVAPVGLLASEQLAAETTGPVLLLPLLEQMLQACHALILTEKGKASQSLHGLQGLQVAATHACILTTSLRLLAAAFFPHAGRPAGSMRALLAASCALRLGAVLARILTASSSLLKLARSMPQGDTLVAAAVDVTALACACAANYASCGADPATELAQHPPLPTEPVLAGSERLAMRGGAPLTSHNNNTSFLEILCSETALLSAVLTGHSKAAGVVRAVPGGGLVNSSVRTTGGGSEGRGGGSSGSGGSGGEGSGGGGPAVAHVVGVVHGILCSDTGATTGKAPRGLETSLSSQAHVSAHVLGRSTTAHLARVHEAMLTCLSTAARQSAAVRQLVLGKSTAAALAESLARRLFAAEKQASAFFSLPLPALTSQLTLLAATACPTDTAACGGLLHTPRLIDALVSALKLSVPHSIPLEAPAHEFSAVASVLANGSQGVAVGVLGQGVSRRDQLTQQLAELRIAAATILANLASKKGSEDVWLGRAELLQLSLGACIDSTVGVRAGGAGVLWALCKNTVRVRTAVNSAGGPAVLIRALQDNLALADQLRGQADAVPSGNRGWATKPSAEAEAAELLGQAAERLQETLRMLTLPAATQ